MVEAPTHKKNANLQLTAALAVLFPAAVRKTLYRSSFMEERVTLAHSSRLLFVLLGKLRQQGFEQLVAGVCSQVSDGCCSLPHPFSILAVQDPSQRVVPPTVHRTSCLNERDLHRNTQRPISSVDN